MVQERKLEEQEAERLEMLDLAMRQIETEGMEQHEVNRGMAENAAEDDIGGESEDSVDTAEVSHESGRESDEFQEEDPGSQDMEQMELQGSGNIHVNLCEDNLGDLGQVEVNRFPTSNFVESSFWFYSISINFIKTYFHFINRLS